MVTQDAAGCYHNHSCCSRRSCWYSHTAWAVNSWRLFARTSSISHSWTCAGSYVVEGVAGEDRSTVTQTPDRRTSIAPAPVGPSCPCGIDVGAVPSASVDHEPGSYGFVGAVSSPDDVVKGHEVRMATIVIREFETQAYPCGCLYPSLSMLLCAWRDPKLRRSLTSQLLTSPANVRSLAIVNRRTEHVRRAQFPIRFPVCCIFPGLRPWAQTRVHHTWTSCEDSDEEAGTATSPDHIIARLQIPGGCRQGTQSF